MQPVLSAGEKYRLARKNGTAPLIIPAIDGHIAENSAATSTSANMNVIKNYSSTDIKNIYIYIISFKNGCYTLFEKFQLLLFEKRVRGLRFTKPGVSQD